MTGDLSLKNQLMTMGPSEGRALDQKDIPNQSAKNTTYNIIYTIHMNTVLN